MKDIVVTVPANKVKEVAAEEADVARREAAGETGIEYYWTLGMLPIVTPRRIYFLWDGAIRAYHEVTHVDRAEHKIYMATKINDVEPIPMKGFRGFRYYKES